MRISNSGFTAGSDRRQTRCGILTARAALAYDFRLAGHSNQSISGIFHALQVVQPACFRSAVADRHDPAGGAVAPAAASAEFLAGRGHRAVRRRLFRPAHDRDLGAAGGDVHLRPRPGPDQWRQLLRVFPERRLRTGLPLHRTVDGAWASACAAGSRGVRVLGYSLLGSVLFFLVTNFGAWLGSPMLPEHRRGPGRRVRRRHSVLPVHGARHAVLLGAAVRQRLPRCRRHNARRWRLQTA